MTSHFQLKRQDLSLGHKGRKMNYGPPYRMDDVRLIISSSSSSPVTVPLAWRSMDVKEAGAVPAAYKRGRRDSATTVDGLSARLTNWRLTYWCSSSRMRTERERPS